LSIASAASGPAVPVAGVTCKSTKSPFRFSINAQRNPLLHIGKSFPWKIFPPEE
jgi:hypothetical protein